jgi:hypothetical protein
MNGPAENLGVRVVRVGAAGRWRYAERRSRLESLALRATAIALGLAVLLATCANAADTAAPELWGGVVAGMTIDQVATRLPQAKPSTGQLLEDLSQSALSVPAQLDGAPADAYLFFRGNGLSAVLVERHDLSSGRRAENLAEARRIVTAATSQYGPPKRCVERRELAALGCTWTAGALKVSLAYHDVGGGSPALSVLYSVAR